MTLGTGLAAVSRLQPDTDPVMTPAIVRNVFGPSVDSISIGQSYTSIAGRLLGKEAKVHAAGDLDDADCRLALRLLNCNPALRWRSLSLRGAVP